MDTLKILGTRLKALRNERRTYQREMGEVLGCTLQHYQKIEHGDVNISALTLCTLARYFDVSTDYLLGLSGERRPGPSPFCGASPVEDRAKES